MSFGGRCACQLTCQRPSDLRIRLGPPPPSPLQAEQDPSDPDSQTTVKQSLLINVRGAGRGLGRYRAGRGKRGSPAGCGVQVHASPLPPSLAGTARVGAWLASRACAVARQHPRRPCSTATPSTSTRSCARRRAWSGSRWWRMRLPSSRKRVSGAAWRAWGCTPGCSRRQAVPSRSASRGEPPTLPAPGWESHPVRSAM